MYIKVFATPSARRETVEEKDGVLIISVREPAQRNFANVRIRQLVAEHYSVPYWKVAILTGHRSRGKLLIVNS